MKKINKKILFGCPLTSAKINGSEKFPQISGNVWLYASCEGSLVVTEICGLPKDTPFFALHIHNGKACIGNETAPFADAGSHLNFKDTSHPNHTGDLPVLLNNNGYAWSAVYTNRFKPCDVKGYPVIIHSKPDDYRSQPSGDSGEKIACGIFK